MIALVDVIVPLIGTVAGYVFQSFSESRNQLYNIAVGKLKIEDDSANLANNRGSSSLRWFIVIAIIAAFVIGPFLFGIFTDKDIFVEQVTTKKGWFGKGREITEYISVNGFPVFKEYREAFMLAVFFILGRRAGR